MRKSSGKYKGSSKEMSDFIKNTPGCLPIEIYRLFGRILAGILLGDTDMHFKNFAMFHTLEGFRLTPSYDQVAASPAYNAILSLCLNLNLITPFMGLPWKLFFVNYSRTMVGSGSEKKLRFVVLPMIQA